MGYFVRAFAVDFERVKAEIGGGDAALAQRYAAAFAADNDYLGQMVADALRGQAEVLTLADVARHMIMGEPYDRRIGFAYGYFLQHLCKVHGTEIDASAWSGVNVAYCEDVDKVLADADLLAEGFTICGLLFGGPPIDLPIDDFPAIGYRPYDALAEPARQLARAGAIDLEERYQSAAYDVFQWLAQADAARRSLVTFYA